MKKKVITTSISAFFLFFLYLVIFDFSGQTGEESGALSLSVSEKCAAIANALTGKRWTEQALRTAAMYFEHPIRKLAHFGEYALMGVFVYGILRPWAPEIQNLHPGKNSGRRLYFLTVLWVLLSAAADELHQLFVPGRHGSPADVALDTFGGFCGMLLCTVCGKIFAKKQKGVPSHSV